MTETKYIKPKRIWLKDDPQFTEKWVQKKIEEDPSILGLGELILKDKERLQPSAGRLDLLLEDPKSNQRYEVEIQLGKTDESHIIRTIEYWDIERKRYPQYDHVAVVVAEDITSRFLNVISLFNGFIPLIAIQLGAYRVGEHITLVCTTVLDQMRLGLTEDDEEVQPVDRSYWEKRAGKKTLAMVDDLIKIIQSWDSQLELKYNKFYIGLVKDERANNFVKFTPKKNWLWLEARIERSSDLEKSLEDEGLEFEYDTRSGRLWIRVTEEDIQSHANLIQRLLKESYENSGL